MSTGAFCNFATDATGFREKFPGLRPILLTLVGQFMFPYYRDYIMTTGENIAHIFTTNDGTMIPSVVRHLIMFHLKNLQIAYIPKIIRNNKKKLKLQACVNAVKKALNGY